MKGDALSRLAGRALGIAPLAQPLLRPVFAAPVRETQFEETGERWAPSPAAPPAAPEDWAASPPGAHAPAVAAPVRAAFTATPAAPERQPPQRREPWTVAPAPPPAARPAANPPPAPPHPSTLAEAIERIYAPPSPPTPPPPPPANKLPPAAPPPALTAAPLPPIRIRERTFAAEAKASPPGRARAREAPAAPDIQVKIGRIELTAPAAPPSPARPPAPSGPAHLGLDKYLDRRRGDR